MAVVRAPDPAGLVEVIRALAAGGVTVAEVTLTAQEARILMRKGETIRREIPLRAAGKHRGS